VGAVALFYAGYFGALGLYWPYFGPFLRELGLGAGAATEVLALAPLCGLIAPPLAGLLADRRRARSLLLRALSVGAAATFVGFLVVRGPAVILVALAFAICRAPLVALADASAVEAAGSSYGRLRAWGSLAFLVAAAGGGEIAARVGLHAVFAAGAIGLGISALATQRVPPPSTPPERQSRPGSLRRLAPFLVAAALAGFANAAYDAGFSLHLERIGLGGRFVGWAWSLGVVSEVGLMAISGRLAARVGAERLFAGALAVGALRWTALAFVRAPALILALQPLHGITFGLFWAAGVATAHHRGGPEAPAATQGLFNAAVSAGSTLGMALAGRALELAGGTGLFLGAAVAAALAAGIASRLRA